MIDMISTILDYDRLDSTMISIRLDNDFDYMTALVGVELPCPLRFGGLAQWDE